MASKKSSKSKKKVKNVSFKVGDFVVYPAHGVGKVTGIEQETIAEMDIELYVVAFEQDKMVLRVPTAKAANSGMRGLSNELVLKDSYTTLHGRPRIKRTMWSRRAQEYEAKINSGDLVLVSEVVRDLHRMDDQPDQSYSERQLYEIALDRMVREVAAIKKITRSAAMDDIIETLNAARRKAAAKKADNDGEGEDEAAA